MSLEEAESLLHAISRELGGDPAATDATRALRLPGFANKKYETDFYVEARRESTGIYHLRDFKLHIDSQDPPSHNYDRRAKRESSSRTKLGQSEHDWAFAKRAVARGDDPEEVIQQIAQHRARDKSDPQDYTRRTVTKATAELKTEADRQTHSSRTTNQNNRERRARENSFFECEERRMSLAPTNSNWMPEPALWTLQQAAVYLNVSRNTIFNLLRRK